MLIICPGIVKTGTKSLALALRQLGYDVHDAPETLEFNMEKWVSFLEGEIDSEFIKETYKDVDAVVDAPCSFWWNIIFKHFPDAKVVLTVRTTPELWAESWRRFSSGVASTMNYNKYEPFLPEISPTLANYQKFLKHIWAYMSSYDNFGPFNKETQIEGYLKHNAYVTQTVPEDQLLVLDVSKGWEPLCTFLDKPIPDTPFPRENVAGKNSLLDQNGMKTWRVFEYIESEISASKKINKNIP